MSDSSPSPEQDLPPMPELDALTWYIYDHFKSLLTAEERAAERVLIGRQKQLAMKIDDARAHSLNFFGVPEAFATYPELKRRIDEQGVAAVMRSAAERVLRDNPEMKILHTCPRCCGLCRTPRAQQCFMCGHDWHPREDRQPE